MHHRAWPLLLGGLVACGGLTPLNQPEAPPVAGGSALGQGSTQSPTTYPYTSTSTKSTTGPLDTGYPLDTGLGGGGGSLEGTWLSKGSGTVVLEFGPTPKDCYINFLGSGYYWAPCAYSTAGSDLFFADAICPKDGTYSFSVQTKLSLTLSLISDPTCKGRGPVLEDTWDYIGPWGSFYYY